MDIAGLDIITVSAMMLPYLIAYFKGSSITLMVGESLFQESYILHYDEIAWMLPKNSAWSALNKEANYNSAAGSLYLSHKVKDIKNIAYAALLLSNEDYSKALLLCIQEQRLDTGEINVIVIKDFLSDGERSIENA